MPDEKSDKPQTFVASTALKSRVCYVVQVVIFFVAVLGLVMFLTVDYVGRSGGIFINIRPCFHEVYATKICKNRICLNIFHSKSTRSGRRTIWDVIIVILGGGLLKPQDFFNFY